MLNFYKNIQIQEKPKTQTLENPYCLYSILICWRTNIFFSSHQILSIIWHIPIVTILIRLGSKGWSFLPLKQISLSVRGHEDHPVQFLFLSPSQSLSHKCLIRTHFKQDDKQLVGSQLLHPDGDPLGVEWGRLKRDALREESWTNL